jgi:hypothetical protein
MRGFKTLLVTTAAAAVFTLMPAQKAEAQVSFGINIGTPPVCEWGYYGYAPYNCAPYGYYGPEWFNNGVFIGAGRWYHGPASFHGGVNRSFDPRYGYHGALPARGGSFHEPPDHFQSFHGSHMADPHGGYHGSYHGGGHSDNHGGHH